MLGEPDASGYRRPLPGFSTNAPALSANDRGGGRLLECACANRGHGQVPLRTARPGGCRISASRSNRSSPSGCSISALITLRAVVAPISRFLGDAGAPRASRPWSAALLTFLVYLAMRPVAAKSLNVKAMRRRRCSACRPRSLFAAFNYYIFYVYAPLDAAPRTSRACSNALDAARDGVRHRSPRARSAGISSSPPGPPSTSR